MATTRWDETWHRLLKWTNDQGPSERLAAQVLLNQGFENLDPSHPLGGKDGGKDAVCAKAGKRWVMGVYFPRDQQTFGDIQKKFRDDLHGAKNNRAEGFAFVTNQELRLAERKTLNDEWPERIELFHLERLTTILDSPAMATVRAQFLGVDYNDRPRGGGGGDADATDGGTAIGGVGGDAGPYGDGGRGGNAIATGQISLAIGGPGGRGGVGPGGNGMDTTGSIGGIVVGGGGGDAPRPDGRGGRGGKSGARLFGVDQLHRLPNGRYPGEGGRGANSPSYEGKATTIKTLLREYYVESPLDVSHADKHSAVPLDWLNARLVQLGTTWRVQIDDGEFEIIDAALTASEHYYKSLATRIGAAKVKPVERNPKGIALIICCRVEWDRFVQNGSFPRNFTSTFDSWESKEFPIDCSPFAAYLLISGSGIIEVSLGLLAPNEEALWERKFLAEHWGEIGTWECSLTIDGLRIPRPGIYRWRLSHGNAVLVERPMVFRHRVEKPIVAGQRDDSLEFPSSTAEPEAAADGGRDSGSS